MANLRLFEKFGIELEYMIAEQQSLNIKPMADQLFTDALGEPGSYVEHDQIAWSNELALHVIELKTNRPKADLQKLPALFQSEINEINRLLAKYGLLLLPSGAHPWMNPLTEARLWPNESNEIYQAYDRIFDCRGHGWVNLQSTHLNLPFSNDEEFAQLHSAIRILLPLLPALAASTPFLDGKASGLLDTRLSFYGGNQRKIPQISGSIIPEVVHSQQEYQEKIMEPMFRAIAAEDPEGVLQHEFLNSRGAIARFGRMAIEIRILDIQEMPLMDISIVALIVEVLKALVAERWSSRVKQEAWHESTLAKIYQQVIHTGRHVTLDQPNYLELFGALAAKMSVNDLWRHLMNELLPQDHWARPQLEIILTQGCLAERMLKPYEANPTRDTLVAVYRQLATCLATGKVYA
jgi:carboxylate-amine ligase